VLNDRLALDYDTAVRPRPAGSAMFYHNGRKWPGQVGYIMLLLYII
jgi:hypothetical protein